jgi:hypothetical protein
MPRVRASQDGDAGASTSALGARKNISRRHCVSCRRVEAVVMIGGTRFRVTALLRADSRQAMLRAERTTAA